jgi:hypothetical protein
MAPSGGGWREEARAALWRLARGETKYDRRLALALLLSLVMLAFRVWREVL